MRKKSKGRVSQRQNRPSQKRIFSIGTVGLLVLVSLGYYLLKGGETSLSGGAAQTSQPNTSDSSIAEVERRRMEVSDTFFSQTRHIKGDPSAPVTLIEFSDFQ